MKAELKEEIFVELPETEEIKRMNKIIQEFTKTNTEILTVLQSQGIKLDSFQANIENQSNRINQLANRIEVLDENHNEVQNMTSSIKESLDKLKSNHVEDQTETNDHFDELENELNGLEVNLNESELILKNHTDQIVQLKTSIDQLNESELIFKNHTDQIVQLKTSMDKLSESESILKNHTDQIDQLKTSIDKLEVEQNETKGIIEDLHLKKGTHPNCNFC
jgi:chromosome segregation ATPase